MERPKSAKHNIERLKKSAYTNYKLNNRILNNNSNMSMATPDLNGTFINGNTLNNSDLIDLSNNNTPMGFHNKNTNTASNQPLTREQRYQMSKSAAVGSSMMIMMRPQSARHNLEKYRQDALMEQQKKIEKLKMLQQANNLNQENNDNSTSQLIVQFSSQNQIDIDELNDQDDEDLDNLDGLLIREDEDDSSSDLEESNNNNNNNNNNNANTIVLTSNTSKNPNKIKYDKTNNKTGPQKINNSVNILNKKSKLLARRTGNNNNNNNSVNQSSQINSTNNNNNSINNVNKSSSVNIYTTFRPTAVTTTYSTTSNILNPTDSDQNIEINNNSNVVTLNITNLSRSEQYDNITELDNHNFNNKNHLVNTSSSNTTTTASNSLSSSSSTSFKTQQQHQQQQQQQQIHLNQNNKAINKSNHVVDATSRDLLNEWYKKDEEVELEIINSNNNNNNSNQVLTQQPPPYPYYAHQRNNNQKNVLQVNNNNNNLIINDNRMTTSNYYANGGNNNTNNQNQIIREKSNMIDPWTKRNPTLVAQNVLLKHRAELDQLSTGRHTNNNSRNTNASTASLLTTTSTTANTNNNKYHMLPDTKAYLKK